MSKTIIPERGTKEFAQYAAEVQLAYAEGKSIERQNYFDDQKWIADNQPFWSWNNILYRVAPTPHPIDQWRAMSKEEREGKVLELSSTANNESRWQVCVEGWAAIDDETAAWHKANKGLMFRIRELTLAERNAEVRERWEAMEETDNEAFRVKDGKRFRVEWAGSDGEFWSANDAAFRESEYPWLQAGTTQYRIVEVPEPPKPKFVPWTRETCPVGAVVVDSANNKHTILSAYGDGAHIGGVHAFVSFKELLNSRRPWRMADGSPCGTEVKP